MQPLTISDLDSIRAEAMMALLNAEGRREIWKYDIVPRTSAAQAALYDQNYDSIAAADDARRNNKPYALVGPGIEDTYFGTVAELLSSIYWLCGSYLGCYLVKPQDTYPNQQEFLKERQTEKPPYPFLPLKEW